MTVLGISFSISRAARTASPVSESENKSLTWEPSRLPLDAFEKTPSMNFTSSNPPFPLSRSVNGIEIELLGAQKAGEYFRAEVCYPLPGGADWLPGDSAEDVTLNDGKNVIPIWGFGMIDEQTSPESVRTKRCDELLFPITRDQELSHFTITIHQLVTSIPEVPDCDLAQKKLDAEGIVIQCTHQEGFFGYEVVQKSDSLTDAQVQERVHESFMESVDGPWIFNVSSGK